MNIFTALARFQVSDLNQAIDQASTKVSQSTVSENLNSGSGNQNIAGGSQFNVSGDLHIHGADTGLSGKK